MYIKINRKNKRIWLKIGGIELKKTEREEMILKVFCEVIQLQKTKETRIM